MIDIRKDYITFTFADTRKHTITILSEHSAFSRTESIDDHSCKAEETTCNKTEGKRQSYASNR